MTTTLPEPERWTDRSPGRADACAEDRLAAALRQTRAATAPSEALLARVERGGATGARAAAGHRWRFALAALLAILGAGGTVGAARAPLRAWAARHGLVASIAPASVSAAPGRTRPPIARLAPSPVPVPALPTTPATHDEPSLELALVVPAPGRRAVPPIARPSVEPPAVDVGAALALEPPAAAEARLLRGVFHDLRVEHRAGPALLVALDDYDRRFPTGLLRAEARLARVEALLALGRRGETLALLDGWEADGLVLTRAARTTRGELRAGASRCAEAAADFAAVLVTGAGDQLGERALFGRASCALRANDEAAAREALTLYLDEHPSGAHAVEARQALARLPARAAPP